MKIDRGFIDTVLGKAETRQEMEAKILVLLGIKDYFDATPEDKKLLRKITSFVLGRDMMLIELSAKECLRLKK